MLKKLQLVHRSWTSWQRAALHAAPLSATTPVQAPRGPLATSTPATTLRICSHKHPVYQSFCRSYATRSPDQTRWDRIKGFPLLVLFGLGALGFVWYVKRKSKESNDTVITAMKKELLKAHRAQGRQDYQRAEDHYHKALKLLSDPIIEDEQEGLEARAVTLDMLANMYLEAKKWIEAENTFRETMRVMLRAGAAKDSDAFVEISLKLARVYHNQNRYKVAEAGFDWGVTTMREKCSQEQTDDRLALLCMCLLCRGTFYSYLGRHAEAIADYTEQIEMTKKIHGNGSLEVAVAYSNLAVAVDAAKDTDGALRLMQTSLDIAGVLLEEAMNSEERDRLHFNMATFYINLATIYSNNGKYSLALEVYDQADAFARKGQDEDIRRQISEGRKICNAKLTT